jgi:hypothetical protein
MTADPSMPMSAVTTTGTSFSKKVTKSRDMAERAATLVAAMPAPRWRMMVSVTMEL